MTGSSRIAASTLVCITLSKSDCSGKPSWRGPYTPALRMATLSSSPSSFQPSPATASMLVTSSPWASAPRSASASMSSALRAVAITRQPSARYWRTSSRPMPREAPMISAVAIRLGPFYGHGGRFAAADAQRRHALLAAGALERADQGDDDARAGGADRVAQRAGAAVDVDLVVRDVEVAHGGHRHGGERFVDLEQVDALGVPADFLVQFFNRADRGGGEQVRFLREGGVAVDLGDHGQAQFLGGRFAHHHQRGGAVVDRRRRGGGDGAVFLERGAQGRDLFDLGFQRAFILVDDGVAGAAGHGDRRDFPLEPAFVGGDLRALDRFDGEVVLRLAGELVLGRALFGEGAHRAAFAGFLVARVGVFQAVVHH